MSNATAARPTNAQNRAQPFAAHDERFTKVLGDAPRLELVIATNAHEGPVYVAAEDALYFTTPPRPGGSAPHRHPRVAIKRLALDGDRFPLQADRLSTVPAEANVANGMAIDRDGRLLVCEQGTFQKPARISRLDPERGAVQTLVDGWRGRALNSPNDVVMRSDGSVWFTDPSYGHLQGFRPPPQLGDRVYCYEPRLERLVVVADSFDKPNGLAFSPDERILYIGDSGANQRPGSFDPERPHHIRAFDVDDARASGEPPALRNDRLFAVTAHGFPDGIKVDMAGRVYASSFTGVQVFAPDGEPIGEINLPGAVNFTFGGRGGNVLFITTDTAVWAAVVKATGASGPAAGE